MKLSEKYKEYKQEVDRPYTYSTFTQLYKIHWDNVMVMEKWVKNLKPLYNKYKDKLDKWWVSEKLFSIRVNHYWIDNLEKLLQPYRWWWWDRKSTNERKYYKNYNNPAVKYSVFRARVVNLWWDKEIAITTKKFNNLKK